MCYVFFEGDLKQRHFFREDYSQHESHRFAGQQHTYIYCLHVQGNILFMKYIALLRGINAGKQRRVDMKNLKAIFESLDCFNVSTYINSGNAIFESNDCQENILKKVETGLKKGFDFEIPILIKTEKEMMKIADVIPMEWQNDSSQRSDVAYLFPEIDSKKTIDELPIKKEFVDIRYIKGAIYWNVDRKNYNKSHLNKITSHKLYQLMTIRNVNTARYLAGKNN
jgi:uncharacterized protein (DUF1697 family)